MTAWAVSRAIGTMTVERRRSDGSLGCSLPCVGCCLELQKLNVRIRCTDGEGRPCVLRSCELVASDAACVTLADALRWGRRSESVCSACKSYEI